MMKISRLKLIACLVLVTICCGGLDFSLAFAEEFRYDSHGKRDPFVSPAEAFLVGGHQLGHGELRLEGVIIDQKAALTRLLIARLLRKGSILKGFC